MLPVSPNILAMLDSADEQQEFLLLYERYRNLMFVRANDILHNEHDAEDAVQEALVRIADNFEKIRYAPRYNQKGFTVTVTENAAKSIYAKNKKERARQVSLEDAEYDVTDTTMMEDAILAAMEAETAQRLIGTLPEADHDVLMLRFIHEYNDREIASLLRISNDAARKRLERAKRRLIALWRKEMDNAPD